MGGGNREERQGMKIRFGGREDRRRVKRGDE